jgi:hypothetical protein
MRAKVVDLIFDTLELGVAFYDWVRNLRRIPADPSQSNPLSYKDVQHQQEQIRQATVRPPAPKR